MANRDKSAADPCTRFFLWVLRFPPISPAVLGELRAGFRTLFAVQNKFPRRNGLVGSSRIRPLSVAEEFLKPKFGSLGFVFTGFRKTSAISPRPKIAIAFRSLTEAQIFPLMSKAMPSTPSSRGSGTKM